jgi:hypothetical protein
MFLHPLRRAARGISQRGQAMHRAVHIGPAILALVLCGVAAGATDKATDEAFQLLFGADFRKAMASPDRKDDEALIGRMAAAARNPSTPTALAILLCDRAHDLGVLHRDGCEALIEAMQVLAERKPERKAECAGEIATIFERRYEAVNGPPKKIAGEALVEAMLAAADVRSEAGDTGAATALCMRAGIIAGIIGSQKKIEIQAVLDATAARQAAVGRAKALRAALADGTRDATVRREIVRLYTVELDDPATAAGFLNSTCDEAMRKYVPAAAKSVADAPELACAELRDWYRGLAQAAAPAFKARLMDRAIAYNKRFLELHGADDPDRANALEANRLMRDELTQVRPERKPPTPLVPAPNEPTPRDLKSDDQPQDTGAKPRTSPQPSHPYSTRPYPSHWYRTYTP